jgi:hypothetical protein
MSLFNFDYRNGRLVVAGGLLVLAGGVAAGGCGGDSGPDVSTEQAFCLVAAQVDCSQTTVVACYAANGNTIGTDTNSCIAARNTPERCNPNNLAYHAAFAGPCLNAHAAVYSSASLDPNALQAMNQACLAVFNAGGTTGVPCADNTGCDVGDGFSCIIHQGNTMGTCQMPVPVTAGNGCSAPNAQCVDASGNPGAYYCEASAHCVSDPVTNGACGVGVPCSMGLRCDATLNTCQPQYSDQHSCTADSDCAGGFCLATNGGGAVCGGQFTLAFGSPTCAGFLNN